MIICTIKILNQKIFSTGKGKIPSQHPIPHPAFSTLEIYITEKKGGGASLVAQWLRIRLPMQGTWVRALVREDATCHGATKPMCHDY